jgi:phosphoadenylyl-sulfate reductase (thioredoxin)
MTTTFRDEIPELSAVLEGRSPEDILATLTPRFPAWIGLATSFGPEDCVLVDVVARARLPIAIFTLDTGCLFAETYALWRRLEERYRLRIRGVKADLTVVEPGLAPAWVRDPDACCAARKVAPLRTALSDLGAWVTGIRRDQTPDRATARVVEWDARFGLVKVNPLVGWTSEDVWAHVRRFEVPTNPLHAQGYASIGCAPCTTPVRPGEDRRSGRWRGREKRECGLHAGPRPHAKPPRS